MDSQSRNSPAPPSPLSKSPGSTLKPKANPPPPPSASPALKSPPPRSSRPRAQQQPRQITSGIKGLIILKTANSAFAGFKRDELTTLPETHDRLLGTEATITWLYSSAPPDFAATRARIMSTLLTTFAQHNSLSIQQTLYAMAAAALAAEPLLVELSLTMPNRHNIPIEFSRFAPPFSLLPDNSIFVPQDEPSGHIHARVLRDPPPSRLDFVP